MSLGCLQFYTLEFVLLSDRAMDYLIFVDIDDNVRPCFGVVQEQLVCGPSNEPRVLVKDVELTQIENWNEMAIVIEYVQWQTILPICQMLSKYRLRCCVLECQQTLEQSQYRIHVLTQLLRVLRVHDDSALQQNQFDDK